MAKFGIKGYFYWQKIAYKDGTNDNHKVPVEFET